MIMGIMCSYTEPLTFSVLSLICIYDCSEAINLKILNIMGVGGCFYYIYEEKWKIFKSIFKQRLIKFK